MNVRSQSLLILGIVFFIALAVRIKPFLYADHFFLVPVDFDEGVYYGASILLTKGVLPYRDFDFAHPPGIVWLFSIWHWLVPVESVAQSFATAKIATAVIGSGTTVGIYLLAKKWNGIGAGLIASLLYATYPEAIVSERSIFLEPFINAAAITAFLLYESNKNRWIPIGLILAWAVSIKVTAVIWIPAFAWLAWQSGRLRHITKFVLGGSLGFVFFFIPWILIDPAKFWEGVIQFQLVRPPDGDIGLGLRWQSILRDQHLAMNLLTALGLLVWPWLNQKRQNIWLAATSALIMALGLLLSSKGFWSQYNTLLALPQALVASFVILPKPLWISHRWLVTSLVLFFLAFPLRSAFKSGRARAPDQLAVIHSIENTPQTHCIFAFEPAWLIMADRFPSRCRGRIILDTYLVMLMDARNQLMPGDSTSAAFATNAAQIRVAQSLQNADIIILGSRGNAQLNTETKDWISRSFRSEGGLFYRSL